MTLNTKVTENADAQVCLVLTECETDAGIEKLPADIYNVIQQHLQKYGLRADVYARHPYWYWRKTLIADTRQEYPLYLTNPRYIIAAYWDNLWGKKTLKIYFWKQKIDLDIF